ncbi:MAG TPA: 50S ribosomal protein L11 methyltransferase [Myxococcales bacterium]|nr:50S ribosomal protein L11 methyltransferase [Myxococcales bacterium]
MSHRLVAQVDAEQAEAAAGLMHLAGASGVEVRDRDACPPGTAALPPDRAELHGYYADAGEAELARRLLAERLGAHGDVLAVAEEPWAESWKRHFQPLRIGRLHVVPPWDEGPTPAGCHRLVLEPGLAFGTGSHETTSLCLEAVDRELAAHPGARLFDVGTGSGILAIAALELGAGRVLATDDDPIAVRTARENARRNGVTLEVRLAGEEPPGTFDVVVANILSNTLVALAPLLQSRLAPGGRLFLSGLLASQADEVAAAFVPPLRELPRQQRGEWVLSTFTID